MGPNGLYIYLASLILSAGSVASVAFDCSATSKAEVSQTHRTTISFFVSPCAVALWASDKTFTAASPTFSRHEIFSP
jgi:hypothetical protein